MKTTFWGSRLLQRSLLLTLAAAIVAVTPAGSLADGLDKFTGYTRPGDPPDQAKDGKIVPVDFDDKKAIGGTIYFRVYDLAEGDGTDPWNTGAKNFDSLFKPGVDSTGRRSPALDRTARYLYVYQALNDRKEGQGKIHSVTIRLLVDPSHITSWGYFEKQDAKTSAITGVSFAAPVTDPKDKEKTFVIPVSTDNPNVGPAVPERMFRNPARPFPMPKPPILQGGMRINNEAKPVADDPLAGEKGRSPDGVVLMRSANFKGAPRPEIPARTAMSMGVPPILAGPFIGAPYGGYGTPFGYGAPYAATPFLPSTSLYGAISPVAYGADVGLGGRDSLSDPDRYAAIRADFTSPVDGPLKKKERSTLFGFTTNDPPMYDAARIRGSSSDIAFTGAEGTVVPANLSADGGVPVPVSYETGGASTGGVSFPMSGGVASGTNPTGGGGGGGFPGVGGIGTAPAAATSGGGGTPSGTGQQQQTGPQQQQQQQQPTPTPTPTPTPISITQMQSQGNQTQTQGNLTQTQQQQQQQKQKQQQQQQQQQKQGQHQNNHCPVHVIPEPAAVVTALLGLPAFLLVRRRRR